jgi:hypothetical protein
MTPAPMTPSASARRPIAQRAVVGQDALLVEGRARQRARVRAGGDDHVLAVSRRFVARPRPRSRRRGAATKEPRPWKNATLFFLNRYRMPSLFCLTTLSLRPASSPRRCQALDSRCRGRRSGGRRARSARSTAAAPSTGCSRRWCRCRPAPARRRVLPLVDAGRGHAELRGADGGDVAAGAAADHDDVEILGHACLSNAPLSASRGTKIHSSRYSSSVKPPRNRSRARRSAARSRSRRRCLRPMPPHTPAIHLSRVRQPQPVHLAAAAAVRERGDAAAMPSTQPRLGPLELACARFSAQPDRAIARAAGAPGLPAPPSSPPATAPPRGRR